MKEEEKTVKELRMDFYKGMFYDVLRLVKKDKVLHSDEIRLLKLIFDKDFRLGDGFVVRMIGLSERLEGIIKSTNLERFLEKWIKFAHANDGLISGDEYEILYKMAQKFGISDERFEELIAPYNKGKKILFTVYEHLIEKYKNPFQKAGYDVLTIKDISKKPNIFVFSPRVKKENDSSISCNYVATGYDLCQRLKASKRNIPVVIVGYDIIESKCKEAGADAFAKDYTPCELLRIVTDLQKKYAIKPFSLEKKSV